MYPGRKIDPNSDPETDYNCNGIYGKNPATNEPYEELLCNGSNYYGFAVLGDSAGAHFELPPSWFNASEWNSTTFEDLLPKALNEFDIPMWSGWSGYETPQANR